MYIRQARLRRCVDVDLGQVKRVLLGLFVGLAHELDQYFTQSHFNLAQSIPAVVQMIENLDFAPQSQTAETVQDRVCVFN